MTRRALASPSHESNDDFGFHGLIDCVGGALAGCVASPARAGGIRPGCDSCGSSGPKPGASYNVQATHDTPPHADGWRFLDRGGHRATRLQRGTATRMIMTRT